MSKLLSINYDAVRALIQNCTNPKKPKVEALTDPALIRRAKILEACAKGDWGCQREEVFKLVSVLEDIPVSEIKAAWTKLHRSGSRHELDYMFRAFVPLTNPNSHDYPLDEVSITARRGDEDCIRPDGTRGNSMATDSSAYRLATKDEIMALPDKQIEALVLDVASILVQIEEAIAEGGHIFYYGDF